MNFSQLHERLRLEIKRRIQGGFLTGSSLANQAQLKPSHISNFLARKRNLSQAALDRVLIALSLAVTDLVPPSRLDLSRRNPEFARSLDRIPLVPPIAAISSPIITRRTVIEIIRTPSGMLDPGHPGTSRARREWRRFVAVRVEAVQAIPMAPILRPRTILILDRHYNSLKPYKPPLPNIYGVHYEGQLIFRYVSLQERHVVLRPYALDHPVELIEVDAGGIPADLIVGRVCLCITQL
jgi:hypothetical protein